MNEPEVQRQLWIHPLTQKRTSLWQRGAAALVERDGQITTHRPPPFDQAAALKQAQDQAGRWHFFTLRHLRDMALEGVIQEEGRVLTLDELGFPPELWQELDAFLTQLDQEGTAKLPAGRSSLLVQPTPQMRQRLRELMGTHVSVSPPPNDTAFHEQVQALARLGLVRLSPRTPDGLLWLPPALEAYRARLIEQQRPVVRPVVVPGTPARWNSKLGGVPDLPPGTPWPTQTSGSPLYFLAQINLAQANAQGHLPDLPRQGLLQFFLAYPDASYEQMQESPELGNPAVRVLYWPEIPEKAAPLTPPSVMDDFQGESFNPPERALAFLNDEEIPSLLDERLSWLSPLVEPTDELDPQPNGHRLGGHPMLVNAAFPPEEDWRLLFQFDGDDPGQQIYGGSALGGWLGFFIRADDLRRLDFSRVHLEMDAF